LIKAVILDLDGTLVHLPINYDKLFHEFSKLMKIENLRPLAKTILKLDEETKKKVFDVWDKAELEALPNMKVNDEGIILYNKFSKKPKALVTMQGKTLVKSLLEHLALSFDFIITRENCLDRTKQLKVATDRLKIPTQNILFIGNTDDDLRAAKITGCQFLRVGK
jgi:phosphoglycolate phosphatase-like HAD superfamily hydrolase